MLKDDGEYKSPLTFPSPLSSHLEKSTEAGAVEQKTDVKCKGLYQKYLAPTVA
jgi:hypothetical protein